MTTKYTISTDYISRAELALQLKVSQQTIARWTKKGKLPPPLIIESTVLYHTGLLTPYLNNSHSSESVSAA